jgi:hypothetical protein
MRLLACETRGDDGEAAPVTHFKCLNNLETLTYLSTIPTGCVSLYWKIKMTKADPIQGIA